MTEGVIGVVALICTMILLAGPPPDRGETRPQRRASRPGLTGTIAAGLLAAVVAIVVDWAVVRAIYGDRFAGDASPDTSVSARMRRSIAGRIAEAVGRVEEIARLSGDGPVGSRSGPARVPRGDAARQAYGACGPSSGDAAVAGVQRISICSRASCELFAAS